MPRGYAWAPITDHRLPIADLEVSVFDNMLGEAQSLLKKCDGYGEIRLERRRWLTIMVINGIVEQFGHKSDMGGFVRMLTKGHGWGIATFNELDTLRGAFRDATNASHSIIPDEPIEIAEV